MVRVAATGGFGVTMTFNPEQHHRRSIRLQDYDYSQNGAYFITLCAHNRECLFGEVVDGEMKLSALGQIVRDEWAKTSVIRTEIELDEFVVMPNHFHAIVLIIKSDEQSRGNPVGAHGRAPLPAPTLSRPPKSLGALVAGFKSAATKHINELRDTPGAPVWQRNYYEHVIRNKSALNDIRSYIQTNPARWADDQENPANHRR